MFYVTQQWFSRGKAEAAGRRLAAGLAGLVAVGVGCGPAGPPDTALFTSPCLTEGALAAVRPVMPVDYLELRERRPGGTYHVLSASGTECDSASMPLSCDS